MTLGTVPERAAKLADPERRAAARDEYDDSERTGQGVVFSMDDLIIGEVHKPELEEYTGLTVAEAAEKRGVHVIDAMLDIALEDDMKALFVTSPRPYDMAAMSEMANSAFALPGVSDGGAHTKFITLGRYPTEFLALLVRDNEVMDLEQAHWRLSAYPALAAGFRDRADSRGRSAIVHLRRENLEMGETSKRRLPAAHGASSANRMATPSWSTGRRHSSTRVTGRQPASSSATAPP